MLQSLRTILRIKEERLCEISLFEQPYATVARKGVEPRCEPRNFYGIRLPSGLFQSQGLALASHRYRDLHCGRGRHRWI